MSPLAGPTVVKAWTAAEVSRHRAWFLVLGTVLMLLGAGAVLSAVLATVVTSYFIGGLMLAGGLVHFANAFRFLGRAWGSFLLSVLVGMGYGVAGGLVLASPLRGALAVTLLLSAAMILIGMFRIVAAAVTWTPSRGWTFVNGLVTLAVGTLIWLELPVSGLWAIGVFVGVDLFFGGWAFVAAAMKAGPPAPAPRHVPTG